MSPYLTPLAGANMPALGAHPSRPCSGAFPNPAGIIWGNTHEHRNKGQPGRGGQGTLAWHEMNRSEHASVSRGAVCCLHAMTLRHSIMGVTLGALYQGHYSS